MSREMSDAVGRIINMSPSEAGIAAELMGMDPEHADAMYQFQSQSQSARGATGRLACFDLLQETPGVDMVLAVAERGAKSLPKAGWIIDGEIAPGLSGVIKTYKFDDSGMKISDSTDQADLISSLEQYGSARIHTEFKGAGSKQHVMAYEDPSYPFKDKQPYDRSIGSYLPYGFENLDITTLSNGGRLLSLNEHSMFYGGLSTSIGTKDLSNAITREVAPTVDINRITDNPEELGTIIGHIALGMGLSPEDGAKLVDASTEHIL